MRPNAASLNPRIEARIEKSGSLITLPELAADALNSLLREHMSRKFGSPHAALTELVPSTARLALKCIGNSDALYHNVEHTMLVTLAGIDIMNGLALLQHTDATDFAHFIVACLLHDIGYVRGILEKDGDDGHVIDNKGGKIKLSRGSSDAALLPYHVDRSKLFVMERLGNSKLLDPYRIAQAIEYTRFPPAHDPNDRDSEEGLLVRAADLIGQLGDPNYLRKANALYCEFEENGMNRQLGYSSPADIIDKFPAFFWNSVSTHLDDGIKYLNMTVSGRQWIANMHHHILCAEHSHRLMGPQR